MVTTEFRHKLIVPTFLASPRRGTALVGKLVAAAAMGAIYAVIASLIGVLMTWGILTIFDLDTAINAPETWETLGRGALALTVWAIIGIGIGSIVRNQVAAIVIALAFTQLVEPVIRVALSAIDGSDAVTKWLPGAATESAVGHSLFAIGGVSGELLPWWLGLVVLLGYGLIFTVIGALSSWRRDVN